MRFVVERGPDRGREIALLEGNVYSVGRDPSNAIPLQDERSSRVHFKLKVKEGVAYIKDNHSTNGTKVNGEWIEEARALRVGDQVQVGDTVFGLAPGKPDATPIPAPVTPTPKPVPKVEAREEVREENGIPLAGKVIAGYQITGKLGRGGMGVVYRATQLSLNREVALKILSKKLTQDPAFIQRFIREARSAAQLNHPNVVQVFDVANENDVYFISMELISGGTVQTRLSAEGKLPVAQALQYAIDAARALVYAQKKGVVHGDIKPDNLMISEAGVVKIADLGLARNSQEALTGAAAGRPAESEGVFGTPHFVSPEQAQGQAVDIRSDIYSLGATLYHMLAGSTPFHGKTAQDIVSQQIKAQPKPVRESNPEVPEDVADIVSKMMQKDPQSRFASAEELLTEMERVQRVHHYGGAGRLSGAAKFAIAASLIVAVVAVGWVLLRPKPEATTKIITEKSDPVVVQDPSLKRELREKDAQVAFTEAEIFARDHGRTEETAVRYDAIASSFGDVEAGRKALEIAVAIRRENTDARQKEAAHESHLAELIEGLRQSSAAALAGERFAAAVASVVSSPALHDLAGTPKEAEVGVILAEARARASEAVAQFVAAAEKLDVSSDITPTLKAGKKLEDNLVLPSEVGSEDDRKFFASLVSKVEASTAALAKRRDVAEAAVRDQDRDLFFGAARAACTLEETLRFEEAAAKLAEVEPKLRTQAYRAREREMRQETERIAALKARLVEAIASGSLKGQDFPLARETKGIASGRATGADANSVAIEIDFGGQGRTTQTLTWESYPTALLFDILRDKIASDDALRLAVAAFGLHAGLFKETSTLLDAITASGSAASGEANAMKARIQREMDAAQRIASVREQFDRGQYRDALRGIEELRAGYADTRAFLAASSGASHYVK